MYNQKQKPTSNEIITKQVVHPQVFDPYQALQYQIYSLYWHIPFYNFGEHTSTGEYQFLKFQQPQPVPCNSVTTQTIDSQFGHQNQKLIESVASQVIVINETERTKNVVIKEENDDQSFIKPVKLQMEEQQYSQSSSIKKQQNFQNNINKNLKSKQQCLENMLKYYIVSPQNYQLTFQNKTKKQTLFSLIVKFFDSKICLFKKSKQQMIKLIIRKTQRYYKFKNNCKKDERFKKYGGFKSMNSVYLQKLFTDSDFVAAFIATMESFVEEFQEENQLKLNLFFSKVCSASNWEEFKSAMKSLDEKNKMPWPAHWIMKLKKVIQQIQLSYIEHNSSKSRSK